MTDTFPQARHVLILCLMAWLSFFPRPAVGAPTGVTANATAVVHNCDAPSTTVSDHTDFSLPSDARQASAATDCVDSHGTHILERASASASGALSTGFLKAFSMASGGGAGTSAVQLEDSFDIRAQRAGVGALIFVITGHITNGGPLTTAHFTAITGEGGLLFVVRGNASVEGPNSVKLSGNAVLREDFFVPVAGLIRVPFLISLGTAAGLRDGIVDFSGTVEPFLELPEGMTFEGSESGLLFADRTDFIIHPDDTLPDGVVPEPPTLALAASGLIGLAVTLRRRRARTTRPAE